MIKQLAIAFIKFSFYGILLISSVSTKAGDLKRIAKKIEKRDYEKAVELIQASLAETEINPGVKYYYAKLFLNQKFASPNLDSARVYIFQAKSDLPKSNQDILEEMAKIPINADSIQQVYSTVAGLHLERALQRNTVEDLNSFLQYFPDHPNSGQVTNARDKLIFDAVLKRSDIEGFEEFLTQYPKSIFTTRAKIKLDSLVVLKHQKSDSKSDLEAFIRNNPDSEYVEDALDHLLRLSTISGRPDDFLAFILKYPNYRTTEKAVDFMFHLDAEQEFKWLSRYIEASSKADSLRSEQKMASTYFFPVFEQTIQLLSLENQKVKTPFRTLDQEFLCEGVLGNFLSGETTNGPGIYSISGSVISDAYLINDLGAGFLLVEKDEQKSIIHKTGRELISDVEDAEIIGGQFIKVKKSKYGIFSLLGEELCSPIYDDFFIDGAFWFVRKDDLLAITSSDQIANSFGRPFESVFQLEDYELINDSTLIGFRDDQECLMTHKGEFLVPWGKHQVFPSPDYAYVKADQGYFYIDKPTMRFNYIASNQSLTTYLMDSIWYLESKKIKWKIASRDTIRLMGNRMGLIDSDPIQIVFETGITKKLYPNDKPLLLSGSGDHLLIKNGKVSTLYDSRGEQIISGNFDKVSLLGDTLLAVNFKGKTGLYSPKGEELLPIEYDQLDLQDGILSTLQNGKIGAYDIRRKRAIEPKYESKISRVGRLYLTKRNGKFGLIDTTGESIVPFTYDAIMEWNDTLVWTQKGVEFYLLNLNDLVPERTVSLLSNFNITGQIVKKFYGDRGFGLIGNKSGVLLQPNFTDIRLIGTDQNQIIVGEQALPQAGYTVITYFDSAGNKIHSQAYRAEEYENVFCDE